MREAVQVLLHGMTTWSRKPEVHMRQSCVASILNSAFSLCWFLLLPSGRPRRPREPVPRSSDRQAAWFMTFPRSIIYCCFSDHRIGPLLVHRANQEIDAWMDRRFNRYRVF